MSQTTFTDPIVDQNECPHFFRGMAGPVVKILLYTDDPIRVKDDVTQPWSLGVMLRHLGFHAPAFASLCIKLVSRNTDSDTHADNRLDKLIKEGDYDQIWFFGIHQGSKKNFTMEVVSGGPHSDLDNDEVEALRNWMCAEKGAGRRGGGVLITGDHAELRPKDAILTEEEEAAVGSPPQDVFWGLGRGLGRRVPRAGEMRQWEGPPTNLPTDSQNTQVLSFGNNYEAVVLQFDPHPQRIILQHFDATGAPVDGRGTPHPLFFYRQGSFIEFYPDHMHEGAVVIPKDLTSGDWPNSNNVIPHIVARGIDNSKMKTIELVGAYNGDRARVGRIVADSTWHHYFNVNLHSFGPPGELNSPTDQIGQFYGNLALWLAPRGKRRAMAFAMLRWLATHPLLLEERILVNLPDDEWGTVIQRLGEKAHHVLSQVASPCEIHELIYALMPLEVSSNIETLHLPERGVAFGSFRSQEFLLPSKELLLGSFVNLYHREVADAESSGGTVSQMQQAFDNVVANGFQRTLEVQNLYVSRVSRASLNWFGLM